MKIITSGLEWIGDGVESIQSTIEQLLRSADSEVTVVTFSISTGADEFFTGIEECLERGVTVSLLINRFNDKQHEVAKNYIKQMIEKFAFSKFNVFDFDPKDGSDLHAKILIVDRTRAIVGSSNISRNGMTLNHELSLLVENSSDVAELAVVVDGLFNSQYANRIRPNS